MIIRKKKAKSISYDSVHKRKMTDVEYIVIHNTGNRGDTAKGNANYFATANSRQAGAHFFIDRKGQIYKTIDLTRTAWSVGGSGYARTNGAGSYYGKCKNTNSISIELCDIVDKYPSEKQIKACKWLIKRLKKKCPNVKSILRHWDVNGKPCPQKFVGKNNKFWAQFKEDVSA